VLTPPPLPVTSTSSSHAAAAAAAAPRSLPASFKRLVAPRTGGSLREVAQVVTLPMLAPGPGDVLLRVVWAGVNGGCETFRARGEHWFASNVGREGACGGSGERQAGRAAHSDERLGTSAALTKRACVLHRQAALRWARRARAWWRRWARA
jgi:hypothetical protein